MKHIPNKILLFLLILVSCTARQVGKVDPPPALVVNPLADSRNPYLRRQMHQPIQWRNWEPEVLDDAQYQNRLLLISIGFSASIWCHKMEEEVFADTLIADWINAHFVPVKVDREERPDVDGYFLEICQRFQMTDCGWPLQIIALPDGRPVGMSTFVDKEEWFNWLQIHDQTFELYPEELISIAEDISNSLREERENFQTTVELPVIREQEILQTGELMIGLLDQRSGGLPGTPKFPFPVLGKYLLHLESSYPQSTNSSTHSLLHKMAFGGIYDQLGGGFFRMARDEKWRQPEFEKMLYDNAQLVQLYAQAYQHDPNPLYEQVVYETIQFLHQEMKSPKEGYYSSLDSKSEGKEGRYYLWSIRDMEVALEAKASMISRYFNLSYEGNRGEGQNVLYRVLEDEQLAYAYNLDLVLLQNEIANSKDDLMKERRQRKLPNQDKKQITSWNALMVSALVTASEAFDEPRWAQEAEELLQFLVDQVWNEEGRLARYYHEGRIEGKAFLDDYANILIALLDVYESNFEEKWLELADGLVIQILSDFSLANSDLYSYAPIDIGITPGVRVDHQDAALPSSNATLCEALFRLGKYLNKQEYQFLAKKMLFHMWPFMQEDPLDYPSWNRLMLWWKQSQFELAIVGREYQTLRAELARFYLPQIQVWGSLSESQLPFLQDKGRVGSTLIYVCQDGDCFPPVSTIVEALQLMEE